MKLFNKKKTDGTEMIGRSLGQETWRRLKKNKGAMMGIAFIILLLIGTALASIFYDYDKDIIGMTRDRFMAPNWQHPFGTDNMGRDIFARVIYGAKYSLFISFGSTLLGLIVGLALGAVAGYYGGLVDNIIMRLTGYQASDGFTYTWSNHSQPKMEFYYDGYIGYLPTPVPAVPTATPVPAPALPEVIVP